MTPEQLSKLKQGDVVRHEPSGADYVVLGIVGRVPIVTRSIQLHTGPDWTHVYTTTPVPAEPAPSIVDAITGLENLGWTFNNLTDRWISPDSNYATTNLRHAWELRHKYNKLDAVTAAGATPPDSVMLKELADAGWERHGMDWLQPGTTCVYVGLAGAWRRMDNLKRQNLMTPYQTPVKSFVEARDALRAAGWVNVAGKVWRAPSGCYFEGTRCAYASMSQGFHSKVS